MQARIRKGDLVILEKGGLSRSGYVRDIRVRKDKEEFKGEGHATYNLDLPGGLYYQLDLKDEPPPKGEYINNWYQAERCTLIDLEGNSRPKRDSVRSQISSSSMSASPLRRRSPSPSLVLVKGKRGGGRGGAAAKSPKGSAAKVPRGSAAKAPKGSAAKAPKGSAAKAPKGSAAKAPKGKRGGAAAKGKGGLGKGRKGGRRERPKRQMDDEEGEGDEETEEEETEEEEENDDEEEEEEEEEGFDAVTLLNDLKSGGEVSKRKLGGKVEKASHKRSRVVVEEEEEEEEEDEMVVEDEEDEDGDGEEVEVEEEVIEEEAEAGYSTSDDEYGGGGGGDGSGSGASGGGVESSAGVSPILPSPSLALPLPMPTSPPTTTTTTKGTTTAYAPMPSPRTRVPAPMKPPPLLLRHPAPPSTLLTLPPSHHHHATALAPPSFSSRASVPASLHPMICLDDEGLCGMVERAFFGCFNPTLRALWLSRIIAQPRPLDVIRLVCAVVKDDLVGLPPAPLPRTKPTSSRSSLGSGSGSGSGKGSGKGKIGGRGWHLRGEQRQKKQNNKGGGGAPAAAAAMKEEEEETEAEEEEEEEGGEERGEGGSKKGGEGEKKGGKAIPTTTLPSVTPQFATRVKAAHALQCDLTHASTVGPRPMPAVGTRDVQWDTVHRLHECSTEGLSYAPLLRLHRRRGGGSGSGGVGGKEEEEEEGGGGGGVDQEEEECAHPHTSPATLSKHYRGKPLNSMLRLSLGLALLDALGKRKDAMTCGVAGSEGMKGGWREESEEEEEELEKEEEGGDSNDSEGSDEEDDDSIKGRGKGKGKGKGGKKEKEKEEEEDEDEEEEGGGAVEVTAAGFISLRASRLESGLEGKAGDWEGSMELGPFSSLAAASLSSPSSAASPSPPPPNHITALILAITCLLPFSSVSVLQLGMDHPTTPSPTHGAQNSTSSSASSSSSSSSSSASSSPPMGIPPLEAHLAVLGRRLGREEEVGGVWEDSESLSKEEAVSVAKLLSLGQGVVGEGGSGGGGGGGSSSAYGTLEAGAIVGALHTRLLFHLVRALVCAQWVECLRGGMEEASQYSGMGWKKKTGGKGGWKTACNALRASLASSLATILSRALPDPQQGGEGEEEEGGGDTEEEEEEEDGGEDTEEEEGDTEEEEEEEEKGKEGGDTGDLSFHNPPPRVPHLTPNQLRSVITLVDGTTHYNKNMMLHTMPFCNNYVKALECASGSSGSGSGSSVGEGGGGSSTAAVLSRLQAPSTPFHPHHTSTFKIRALCELTAAALCAGGTPLPPPVTAAAAAAEGGKAGAGKSPRGSTTLPFSSSSPPSSPHPTPSQVAAVLTLASIKSCGSKKLGRNLKHLKTLVFATEEGEEEGLSPREVLEEALKSALDEAQTWCLQSMDLVLQLAPMWGSLFVSRYAHTMYNVPLKATLGGGSGGGGGGDRGVKRK